MPEKPEGLEVGTAVATVGRTEVEKGTRPGEKKTKLPRNFEKLVSAAYVMALTGYGGMRVAARVSGLAYDTISRAKSKDYWPLVEAEAHTRWLEGMDAQARRELGRMIKSKDQKGKGKLVMDWLKARTPALQPAQKVEVTGAGGGPLTVIVGAVPAGFGAPDGE